ncbi:putative low-complexity protein [Leptolyngbya sp. PCC 7375]|nr:putative low-complexity protein [Leptolyngbya sp. PCC 7375]
MLSEQLQQAKLDQSEVQRLIDQITWGTYQYLYQAIAEAGESIEPLAELYRIGGQQEQDRQVSIDSYLKNVIEPLPEEQVFDESDPLVTFNDIYVPLKMQPLTQSGESIDADPINIHTWAQSILERTGPRKVMFIQGDAGQGKSVFCRMFADWVRQKLRFSYIPIFIRLRSLRVVENNLTETLETCPDLEPIEFVGKEGWLKDKNTRFLIILDGFDELLLQGLASGGLQEFLQQVSDFQERSHHQCLVTGRPLALQGIEQRITQNKSLERVKLQPMDDALREQWLTNWQSIFGEAEVTQFRTFLEACPEEISNNLAREPLLIYLLGRLHREGRLTSEMFANAQQESQAKLRIYQESVNWVLENQRQDENQRLSGLDADDLREVLQEAALCVVQSGNETAQLTMLKARFQDSSNSVADLLKESQKTTGQSDDKALNSLLTTFYLRPGEGDKRGSVEFAHKSFGEYLFAERLMAALENWTDLDKRRKRFLLDDRTVYSQIYDLLGFSGLSVEIVEYLFELLDESEIDRVKLFQRLHIFYERWCEGEFLNLGPTENLPQQKKIQLSNQNVSIGLKQIDICAGLNVLAILFKLHAEAQAVNYPKLSVKRKSKPKICFHPCGEPDTEAFDEDKLLKIIHYGDSLGPDTFTRIVGPHLSNANFYSTSLDSANLFGANLFRANLANTNLFRANLSKANLSRANLSKANLSNANLSKANLFRAELNNANFYSANLDSVNLSRARLFNAYLSRANLFNAYLFGAYLSKADLDSADLDSADLNSAYLAKAYLYSANLYGANLYNTDLSRANFDNANLYSANLNSAILLGTKLRTAQNLTNNQLQGKIPPFICNSTLPSGLEIYQNRDCDRLPAILKARYSKVLDSLEAAQKFINDQHTPLRK